MSIKEIWNRLNEIKTMEQVAISKYGTQILEDTTYIISKMNKAGLISAEEVLGGSELFNKRVNKLIRRQTRLYSVHSNLYSLLYDASNNNEVTNTQDAVRFLNKQKLHIGYKSGDKFKSLSKIPKVGSKYKRYFGAPSKEVVDEVLNLGLNTKSNASLDEIFGFSRKMHYEFLGGGHKKGLHPYLGDSNTRAIKGLLRRYENLGTLKVVLDQVINNENTSSLSNEAKRLLSNIKVAQDLSAEDARTFLVSVRKNVTSMLTGAAGAPERYARRKYLKTSGAEWDPYFFNSPTEIGKSHLRKHYYVALDDLKNQGVPEGLAHKALQNAGVNPVPTNFIEERRKGLLVAEQANMPKGWTKIFYSRDATMREGLGMSSLKAGSLMAKAEIKGFYNLIKSTVRGGGTWFDKLMGLTSLGHGNIGFKSFAVTSALSRQLPAGKDWYTLDPVVNEKSMLGSVNKARVKLGLSITEFADSKIAGRKGITMLPYRSIGGVGKIIGRVGINLPTVFAGMAIYNAYSMADSYKSFTGGLATEITSWWTGGLAASLAFNVATYGVSAGLDKAPIYKRPTGAGQGIVTSAKSGKMVGIGRFVGGSVAAMAAYYLVTEAIRMVGYSIFGQNASYMQNAMPPGIIVGDPANIGNDHVLISQMRGNSFEGVDPSGMNLSAFGSGYNVDKVPALNVEVDGRPIHTPVNFERTIALPQKMWYNRHGSRQADRNYSVPAPVVRQRIDRVAV